jgi:hypothetical protein
VRFRRQSFKFEQSRLLTILFQTFIAAGATDEAIVMRVESTLLSFETCDIVVATVSYDCARYLVRESFPPEFGWRLTQSMGLKVK